MFNDFIFTPMYNLLIYIVYHVPGHYMWVSVAVTTFIIKFLLIPLYKKQIRDGVMLKHMSPQLKAVQEKYKNKTTPEDKQKMMKETMELYKKYKANPFVSILILIIQLPILFALYRIFVTDINSISNTLYSFVQMPEFINSKIGSFELSQKSILFGILTGISQFMAGYFMFAKKEMFGNNEFGQAMQMQMKFFLPVFIGVISCITPIVVAVYFITANLFAVIQEILIKRPLESKIEFSLKNDN